MNGIILLDKPPGMTSHDAVDAVRGVLPGVKVGHAGTLDPNATGILILLLGKATKISRFLMGLEKEYIFTMQLGVETDTLDRWGKPTKVMDTPERRKEDIAGAAAKLLGRYEQVAPSVSALKYRGVPLYKLARRGEAVPKKVRSVEIRSLDVLNVDHPLVTARVVCSSGTYVRSLARDLGYLLGTVASVFCLRRTRVGDFGIDRAVSLDSVLKGEGKLEGTVLPLRVSLGHLPHLELRRQGVEGVRLGRQPRKEDLSSRDSAFEGEYAVLVDPDGEPVAIVRKTDGSGGPLATERIL
jgi:tRNA pseudouridine55 synthase